MSLDPLPETRKERRRRGLRLRPMGVGELLDEALVLYRENAKLFLAVIWFPALVIAVCSSLPAIAMYSGVPTNPVAVAWIPVVFLAVPVVLIAWAYQQAAITYAIAERYLEQPVTASEVRARVWEAVLRLLGSSLLAGLLALIPIVLWGAVTLGASYALSEVFGVEALGVAILLFGSCGFVFLVFLVLAPIALVPPVVVVEQAGVLGAIARSARLAFSRTFRVVGIVILIGIVSVILSLIVELAVAATFWPFGGGPVFREEPITQLTGVAALQEGIKVLLSSALSVLIVPFTSAAIVLTYFDLRIRNEGFDIEQLAKSLHREPAVNDFAV